MESLFDQYGRVHDYLRVSVTERCNLRCHYCMPEEGIPLAPKEDICSFEELLAMIDIFCKFGVRKVRITGGEPLVRKGMHDFFLELGKRPVELALTTNGVLADRFIDTFEECGLQNINLSLDSLQPGRFEEITRRTGFGKVMENIHLLIDRGCNVKLNMVVMRNINDNEIVDFAELTRNLPITVRYIEFMPFDGNQWINDKMVSAMEIRAILEEQFRIERGADAPHDTTRHHQIPGYRGRIGIISSMSEHFCGSCNRIRLLANGAIKNCLFSEDETDLRTPFRNGQDIRPLIRESIHNKRKEHAGMIKLAEKPVRSMTTIGG